MKNIKLINIVQALDNEVGITDKDMVETIKFLTNVLDSKDSVKKVWKHVKDAYEYEFCKPS